VKIYVIDSWRKHWTEGVEWWRAKGHDVKTGIYWGPQIVEENDVVIFHPVDNNLKTGSHKHKKPKDTVVIAEAVDIDIYAGHLGAVDWSYVDHLVFMAKHMQEFAARKFGAKIADVPQTIIPGGIDLDKWTLREGEIGHNIAWIGRLWVPKDVFGALMVFNELITQYPVAPWRLFILHDNKWHPEWYKNHTLAYLEANPKLKERVEWVRHVPDVNVWFDEMKIDYLLQTSQKEAFGYVIAQAAAKGIRPVIRNTNGAQDLWPWEWVFNVHDGAVGRFEDYTDRNEIRQVIADRYPLSRRMEAFDALIAQYA